MKTLARLAGVVLVAALTAAPARPADPKPISEADLLKLVELKIPDEVIQKRITESGVEFPAEDATFKRIEKAGASAAVVAAVRKAAKPAPETVLALWVAKNYDSWDCSLHSELVVNGKSLGKFTSTTDRAIGEHLKTGWNTITLKTAPQPESPSDNQLIFRIGPVHKNKDGKRTMTPLWEFRNGTDWKLNDGKYTHPTNPDAKDVTLTYQVYYAGVAAEGRKLGAGDYVLTGDAVYDSWNGPVTATVWVNGQAVNTFLGHDRQLVITQYLRKGENTIKLVSSRVPNVIADNDVKCWVGGPAEYSVTAERYEVKPVVQFEAMTGWKRDKKSGQLMSQAKADADKIEREIKFTLDHEPGKK